MTDLKQNAIRLIDEYIHALNRYPSKRNHADAITKATAKAMFDDSCGSWGKARDAIKLTDPGDELGPLSTLYPQVIAAINEYVGSDS